MTAFVLVVLLTAGGQDVSVPLEIFPENGAGLESCEALRAEILMLKTFPQAQAVTCARYRLTPKTEETRWK